MLQLRTIDLLEHGKHVLEVVVIQEPYLWILVILLERQRKAVRDIHNPCRTLLEAGEGGGRRDGIATSVKTLENGTVALEFQEFRPTAVSWAVLAGDGP